MMMQVRVPRAGWRVAIVAMLAVGPAWAQAPEAPAEQAPAEQAPAEAAPAEAAPDEAAPAEAAPDEAAPAEAPPAEAPPAEALREPTIYGGASAGGHFILSDWDFAERDAGAVPVSPESGPLLDLRLGWQPIDWIAVEGVVGYFPFEAAGETNPGLHYHLDLRISPLTTRVRPFLIIGAGLYHNLASDPEEDGTEDADLDGEAHWGLGVRGALDDRFLLRAELRHHFTDSLDVDADYAETLAVTVGLDVALYTPPLDRDSDGITDDADRCPDTPGHGTAAGCPDRDGDTTVDRDDACPDQAGPAPLRGCPDRDGDGVADPDDQCPDVAGVAEAQGCPPDSDGDGLIDPDDQCPQQPEDKDGLDDEDGCPEDDVDGDGIGDADDKCPREKEVVNDYLDADGCPDARPAVVVTCDRFELDDTVYFDPGKFTIQQRSLPLLDKVAQALIDNPWVTKIRIEGHTDGAGDAGANKRLSQQRVWVVRTYLIDKGVAKARLTQIGYGEEKPIADNGTEEGRAQNRRVEFVILQKGEREDCKPGGAPLKSPAGPPTTEAAPAEP